jgi:hypothetical protein
MRRAILMTSLLAGIVAFGSAPAQARVSADINIHVGGRGPVFYSRQPRVYAIPSSEVYYVQGNNDCDTYRYGDDWYVNDGGNWYCGQSWRGPFVQVSFARVPRVILQVPSRYHRQTRGYWQGGGTYRSGGQWGNNDPRYRNGGQYGNDRRSGNGGQWDGRTWNGQTRNDGTWNGQNRDGGTWNDGTRRNRDGGQWNQDGGHGQRNGRGNGQGNGRGNGRGHGHGNGGQGDDGDDN